MFIQLAADTQYCSLGIFLLGLIGNIKANLEEFDVVPRKPQVNSTVKSGARSSVGEDLGEHIERLEAVVSPSLNVIHISSVLNHDKPLPSQQRHTVDPEEYSNSQGFHQQPSKPKLARKQNLIDQLFEGLK